MNNSGEPNMTTGQAAVLLFVFLTCSGLVSFPGQLVAFAGSSAWLSLFLAAVIGLLLLIPLVRLSRTFPGRSFIECSRSVVGFPFTLLLGLLFLIYLIQMGSSAAAEIAVFLKSTMLRDTPAYWLVYPIFLIAALSVRTGLDKMAALFVLVMAGIIVSAAMMLVYSGGEFDPSRLLPFMAEGPRPLLRGVYYAFGIPYAEAVVFLMILPYAAERGGRPGGKLAIALIAAAVMLALLAASAVMIFGPIAGERRYSLFEIARTVTAPGMLLRFEAATGCSLIFASIIKTTIALFAAHRTLTHMLVLKRGTMLIFPLAMAMAAISMSSLSAGSAGWAYDMGIVYPMSGLLLGVLPALIVYLVSLFRKIPKP